ncbi:hypothetical protein QCA50_019291 [Cerrena zonata]|uniref:Uncharacterized protein n=1 Tax=Cerrena zonata TaxID=2478898 RepID=A0AAW0FHW7_9APHY
MQQMQLDAQIGAQYQQQLYARCARGDHDIEMKHGVCGVIAAVLLFPIGLICLLFETHGVHLTNSVVSREKRNERSSASSNANVFSRNQAPLLPIVFSSAYC